MFMHCLDDFYKKLVKKKLNQFRFIAELCFYIEDAHKFKNKRECKLGCPLNFSVDKFFLYQKGIPPLHFYLHMV